MFDANYGSVYLGNSTEAAAFQMALWNALYDVDLLVGAGAFSVTSLTAGATAQADAYLLAAASYAGGQRYSMTFLESLSGGQNLVTVAPIPLPATALLLVGAHGRSGRAAPPPQGLIRPISLTRLRPGLPGAQLSWRCDFGYECRICRIWSGRGPALPRNLDHIRQTHPPETPAA